jgi:hypothetical protein
MLGPEVLSSPNRENRRSIEKVSAFSTHDPMIKPEIHHSPLQRIPCPGPAKLIHRCPHYSKRHVRFTQMIIDRLLLRVLVSCQFQASRPRERAMEYKASDINNKGPFPLVSKAETTCPADNLNSSSTAECTCSSYSRLLVLHVRF